MDESLSEHSRFVPFDVDDCNPEEVKERAKSDPYVFAVWVSPTGTGVHGLIKIADGTKHKEHYNSLLKRYPMFDSTSRNPSRILYLSYDPTIYINSESQTFFEVLEEKKKSDGIALSSSTTDYSKVDVIARMIRTAKDGEKHHTLIKASYLCGGFVGGGKMEEPVAEFMLQHEISKRSVDDLDAAYKTIRDGLNQGVNAPIKDIEEKFAKVLDEVGVSEDQLSFLADPIRDEDYIRKFRAGLITMGKPFGYFDLDPYLLLKEGEFYATLAHSHIGKTSINLWLIFLSALLYDWSWVIYTGENRTPSVMMRLMEFHCGCKIKDMPQSWFDQALKWVKDRFYLVNNDNMHTHTEILQYTETMSKYKAIKGVLIDPKNALKKSMGKLSSYDYDVETYTEMLLFTKRTNITLFLSIHTNSTSQRNRDNKGLQTAPYPSDADGGSILYNKADIFITAHRNIQDQESWMNTIINIGKMRNIETGGGVTKKGEEFTLRINKGIEFVDIHGCLPFKRDYLTNIIIQPKEANEVPFLN